MKYRIVRRVKKAVGSEAHRQFNDVVVHVDRCGKNIRRSEIQQILSSFVAADNDLPDGYVWAYQIQLQTSRWPRRRWRTEHTKEKLTTSPESNTERSARYAR